GVADLSLGRYRRRWIPYRRKTFGNRDRGRASVAAVAHEPGCVGRGGMCSGHDTKLRATSSHVCLGLPRRLGRGGIRPASKAAASGAGTAGTVAPGIGHARPVARSRCYTRPMTEARRSRKKTRVTSLDIAHRAGVSQATVSRVLAGSPLVNAETRRRVELAVRELNYKVDRHASSLRTQRAGTLALLLFEDPTQDDSHINPFFLSMLGSITRACARHGYGLLVSFQQLSD